jgi:hypothetical protein
MDRIRILNFLPRTATGPEHAAVIELMKYVETIAQGTGGAVLELEATKGEALILVNREDSQKAIIDEFRQIDGVKVDTVPALAALVEINKKRQERADRMAASRAAKKNQ